MADARLGAQADEVLTDGVSSRRLAALSAEALTANSTVPERRLAAVANEALTGSSTVPQRYLGALSIEALVPARLTFVGWGTPIRNPVWS